jgi:hypothetical protein
VKLANFELLCRNNTMASSTRQDGASILCFEHCNHRIFAFALPEQCPKCFTPIANCQFSLPPFQIPSPFSRAQDHPCSIVIKPTKGDFLKTYRNGDNLHCAVTSSKGFVIEFDETGVHRERTLDWNQCVVSKVLESGFVDSNVVSDHDWSSYWDWTLEETIKADDWSEDSYSESDKNCFSFVLSFLRALKHEPLSSMSGNKLDFCKHFILPKTTLAAKFICLYRKMMMERDGTHAARI